MTQQKKKRKKSRDYFTQKHEDAIIEFVKTNNRTRKNYLYLNVISPAFNEMIEKIVFTYKFVNLPNIDLLKDECAVYLSTILSKYDPNRNSKAFSYFSVVVKNWFSNQAKQNKKKLDREVDLEEISKNNESDFLSIENPYDEIREKQEFFSALWNELSVEWVFEDLKENEQKVLSAIRELLKEPDDIEIFNKKAVYLYLREMTGLNTKQILQALSRFKKSYNEFREDWNRE